MWSRKELKYVTLPLPNNAFPRSFKPGIALNITVFCTNHTQKKNQLNYILQNLSSYFNLETKRDQQNFPRNKQKTVILIK